MIIFVKQVKMKYDLWSNKAKVIAILRGIQLVFTKRNVVWGWRLQELLSRGLAGYLLGIGSGVRCGHFGIGSGQLWNA